MIISNKVQLPTMAGAILMAVAMLTAFPVQARSDKNVDYNHLNNNGVEIEFPNGCRVSYNRYGTRTGHHGPCKNQQYSRADEYSNDYLDDQGYNSHHSNNYSSNHSVPESQMRKYCQGEASSKLNTRPTNLNTENVEREGNKYVVYGRTNDHSSTFECHFNRHGEFDNVQVRHNSYNQGNYYSSGHNNHNNKSHNNNSYNNSSHSGDIPNSAKQRCRDQFGVSNNVTSVSALRPGYWEVVMQAKNGPQTAACTVRDNGEIEDWVELN